ncbi:hypothetical protein ACET3Z_008260 [Daucus carota]
MEHHFVHATSSCKEWKEFAEDTEILKTVQFVCEILQRKLDTLGLFMQRMKARHSSLTCAPQSRNELRHTHDFFFPGM